MDNNDSLSSDPGNLAKDSQFLSEAEMVDCFFDEDVPSSLEQKPTVESSASQDSNSPSRNKISGDDIRQLFRFRSVNTSAVTREQVLRIKKVHDMISYGAKFNFNYATFLLTASIVAGLGLVTGSSVTVISSMLLSPIMGPVIGMAYGFFVWDWPLIKRSLKNELLSILLCVIFGLIIGSCTFMLQVAELWPTEEMLSRCTKSSFYAGIPIAFFSGMGVALSLLDDQVSSLVGVAISASLLPPAVNAGILAIIAFIRNDVWVEDLQNSGDHFFHYNQNEKFAAKVSGMALTSLLLTVSNVIFVAIGAITMFRLKEVLPVEKTVFWTDLKVARRIYQGRARDLNTGRVIARLSRMISRNHDEDEVPAETSADNN